ncbi:MAG: hypothetical protein LC725_05015, partial [Lentisphaerae bacterium]|nr:hypothetical protein [Lentisphaerota bacterium]
RDTASREFTNSNVVDVVEFPLPLDYDRYQITESGDIGAIDPNAWISTAIPYTELTFPQPAGNATITRYAWFTNSSASVFLLRGKGEIKYTEVLPEVAIKSSLTRKAGGYTLRITGDDIDAGSTSGLFDGQPIGIHQLVARLESGPEPDLTPGEPYVTLREPGVYELSLTVINNAGGTVTSSVNCVVTLEALPPSPPGARHVAIHNMHPTPPYTNWYTAATHIQDAVNVADPEDTILVGPGRYNVPTNAVVSPDGATNVLFADKLLMLRSIDGAANTIIDGEGLNRCMTISYSQSSPRFILDGFTLTNGYAPNGGAIYYDTGPSGTYNMHSEIHDCVVADNIAQNYGGATYVNKVDDTTRAIMVVSNSVFRNNKALTQDGGAIYRSTSSPFYIYDSLFEYNTATASGKSGGALYFDSNNRTTVIYNSVFRGNRASTATGGQGGAIYTSRLTLDMRNCLLIDNLAREGGAIYLGRKPRMSFVNTTIVGNQCTLGSSAGGIHIGGTDTGYLQAQNTILYHNTGGLGNLRSATGYVDNYFTNSCTTPDTLDPNFYANGSITNEPSFVDFDLQNYHLASNSPCLDAGLYQSWMDDATDLDGNPRIMQGVVDIGCYERPDFSMAVDPLTLTNQLFQGNVMTNLSVDITATGMFPEDAHFAIQTQPPATSWLRPVSTNETISPPFPESVTVGLISDTGALAPGVYTGIVGVAVTNAGLSNYDYNWSNDVTVTLNLAGLSAAPNILSNVVVQGQDAAQQSFKVISSGIGEFTYTITPSTNWVTASPDTGVMTDAMTNGIDVSYSTVDLPLGRHTAILELASTNWGGATQYVDIVLDVVGLAIKPVSISNQVFLGYGMADRTDQSRHRRVYLHHCH